MFDFTGVMQLETSNFCRSFRSCEAAEEKCFAELREVGQRARGERMSERGVWNTTATARGIGAPGRKMCRCGLGCSSPPGAQGGYLMYLPEFYLLSVGYGAHGTVYE